METKERVEEQIKKLVAFDSNPRNLDQFGLSSSSAPIPIKLTIILFVGYPRSSILVYFLPDSPFSYILPFFFSLIPTPYKILNIFFRHCYASFLILFVGYGTPTRSTYT